MKTNQVAPGHSSEKAKSLEDSARGALALQAGKGLTDVEWERARTRLSEFFAILRAWEGRAKAKQSEPDTVVTGRRQPTSEHAWDEAA